MEYLQNARIYNANDVFFVENTYLNYRDNFGLIFIFSCGLAVIAFIISTLLKASKKSNLAKYQPNKVVAEESDEPIKGVKNTDTQYSISADKTNIIILEDIDKLTSAKMLEIIEEIKYLCKYENCITIVPFDEEVLAKAISIKNDIKTENDRPLEFEKLLDKLFQFKIYVPRIANENIKDYAVELADESVPAFIEEYCEKDVFNKVIKNVLIYKDVVTPRHVKKLINNFINNKMLVTLRAQNNKIDESILENSNFDYQLAKVSVIQSDFNELYNTLFKDFGYMEMLTNLYELNAEELRNAFEQIDEDLKPFFTVKYRPLRNFLKQTKKIEIDNLSLLMYLTKVKTEIMFKDKKLYSYVSGEENITELRIQEVLELVKLI
nr:KAP family NTPase [Clostridia bacterium]